MEPENFQPANTPRPETEPSEASINNSPRKSKRLYLIILLVAVLGLLAGIFAWQTSGKPSGQQPSKASGSLQFFGNKIPRVGCDEVKNLAQDRELLESSISKYRCYKGSFSVGNEKMSYAEIQLTPEFEKEWQKKCTLDCGISPDDYPAENANLGSFIIRANGSTEHYVGLSGGGLEALLTDLTGCGTYSTFGTTGKLKEGTLVIDDGKLGSLSKFSGLKVTDSFGNICNVDLELVSYLTSETDTWELTDSISIKRAAIHYELKDTASCESESAPSFRQTCYTAQAALRNNVNICESLASPTPQPDSNTGFDNCVIAVAKRSRNPQICDKIRYYREQFMAQCQDDTSKYKSILKSDITIK